MINALEIKQLVIPVDGMTGDLVPFPVLYAPSATNGGAVTIVSARYFSGTATSVGTAHSLQLLRYTVNSGGTMVLSGTVSAALGGTAAAALFGNSTFHSFSLTDPIIPANNVLVAVKDETNTSTPTRGAIIVEYVYGT